MIRKYKPKDEEQCIRIFREIGWMDGKESDGDVFGAYISEASPLVAELNGEIEVFVVTRTGSCKYQDGDIPFSAVTGVATSRVARQQGLASSVTARAIAKSASEGAVSRCLACSTKGIMKNLDMALQRTTEYRRSTQPRSAFLDYTDLLFV